MKKTILICVCLMLPFACWAAARAGSRAGGSTVSDGRLKNVEGVFDAGLAELRQLTPVRYRYKKNNPAGIRDSGEHVGLIAQEVQAVIPEAVQGGKGYLTLDHGPILFAMLNAIKEQAQEIESLKAEMDVLRRQGR
ncbi:MAG: hypothetical protein A3G34_15300 [Candidatus Lindowbacteria bacterium RIFCSPLOWO2_12_FULL_62_27]|nr:MAG: hypothetical protein A3G34_15300 [Candidatus Lindowbacteria bacterium RIFCSPLOWO2_12_FULL_62_27]OGH63524.1 MAG: hypothetical protein A3I06_01865 [Candidatus Lindowbacteria bacterium RIFCSPLOWO2_02_FULL_62_12]